MGKTEILGNRKDDLLKDALDDPFFDRIVENQRKEELAKKRMREREAYKLIQDTKVPEKYQEVYADLSEIIKKHKGEPILVLERHFTRIPNFRRHGPPGDDLPWIAGVYKLGILNGEIDVNEKGTEFLIEVQKGEYNNPLSLERRRGFPHEYDNYWNLASINIKVTIDEYVKRLGIPLPQLLFDCSNDLRRGIEPNQLEGAKLFIGTKEVELYYRIGEPSIWHVLEKNVTKENVDFWLERGNYDTKILEGLIKLQVNLPKIDKTIYNLTNHALKQHLQDAKDLGLYNQKLSYIIEGDYENKYRSIRELLELNNGRFPDITFP